MPAIAATDVYVLITIGQHRSTDIPCEAAGQCLDDALPDLIFAGCLVTMVNVARIRDQLFLQARGASSDEILLRQRQLATSYSYAARFT